MALTAVLTHELTWVAPHVAAEIDSWRKRAEAIPDDGLRRDALETLDRERLNPEGAALFTALGGRRDRSLLRVLVAYQVALDFLDTISEQPSDDSLAHGMQMHRALIEAVEPGRELLSDYYAMRPGQDDGGYLGALVQACQIGCAQLPGFVVVRPYVATAARRLLVQVLNHEPEPDRTPLLIRFAHEEFPAVEADTSWFEMTAAASSTLGLYALLALAVQTPVDAAQASAVDAAYHPWICLACTLLDCFVDQLDDAASGAHNYLDRYDDRASATERLCEIVDQALARATTLHKGERHAAIVSAMIAMYLAKDSAATAELRSAAQRIAASGGALVRWQIPVLRWLRRRHDVTQS